MTEEQFTTFLYSCRKMANKLHFNNEDGIVNFIGDKTLDEQTFCEVVSKNSHLLKALNSGVCFTMSSYVFELLHSIGLDKDYYFMETANNKWNHVVILYKSPDGFKICDLATQVLKQEEIMDRLVAVSIVNNEHPGQYSEDEITGLVKELSSTKYLSLDIDDFIKEYPLSLCRVLLHQGHEEDIYTKVPRMALLDFIKNEVEKVQASRK